MELSDARKKIEELDTSILKLIAERTNLAGTGLEF